MLFQILSKFFTKRSFKRFDEELEHLIQLTRDNYSRLQHEVNSLKELKRIEADFFKKLQSIREESDFCRCYAFRNELFLFSIKNTNQDYCRGDIYPIWSRDSLGFISMRLDEKFSAFDLHIELDHAKIVDFHVGGVRPMLRRKGLGRFAYTIVEEILLERAVTLITGEISCLNYFSENDTEWRVRLQGFWESNGFLFQAPQSIDKNGYIEKRLNLR